MKKLLILLLIGILFVGCATKKKSYEFKENIKFDSISYKSDKVVYPALKDTVYIKSPCDSITGQLKDFSRSFTTQIGKIIVEGRKGALTASIDLKESSTTTIEKDKTSKHNNTDIKSTEVVRYKVDWRLWLALILSLLLNAYFIYSKFIK